MISWLGGLAHRQQGISEEQSDVASSKMSSMLCHLIAHNRVEPALHSDLGSVVAD